ncbi:ribonuclease H-like domain-containing protein [Sporolactobacillus vineae]|uniref:ribonuclease H-like domain-containing protein n=1 Tax=Sporolactobacillus vineae TaxID=444463 RepID=UPI000288C74A|nr:ribonuclease H-like domain-containing protein [Sporolactobacillus vineae]
MSLKQKLALYKKQLHQAQQAEKQPIHRQTEDHSTENESEILVAANALKSGIRRFEDEYVLVHSEQLSLTHKIGPYRPGDLFRTVALWHEGPKNHPLSAAALRAEDLLFFDTETTGLSAGAGEMIFLIGMARVNRNGVVLKQYLLPGPGHEVAFYDAFLSDCGSLKNLVTFNGKAFDWPRVKTRYQFVRDQVPRLPAFGHFDLLHASRRLWKDRLDSVRLQSVEKAILSMGRTDDVPGKMAPYLYFKFLKHPDAGLISGILEHNREDVLSLISLYIHLSGLILGDLPADEGESFQIGRWFAQLGAADRARSLFEPLALRSDAYGIRSKIFLAKLCKRAGKYGHALSLFRSAIAEEKEPDNLLFIEAAKLMEHQFRDYSGAMHYTQRAIHGLRERANAEDHSGAALLSDCLKRLNRLDQKMLRENNG